MAIIDNSSIEDHRERFAKFKLAIKEDKIILFTGPIGCGKTNFIHKFKDDLKHSGDFLIAESYALEVANVKLSTLMDALFLDISQEKNPKIPRKDREKKLVALMKQSGKSIILFVDDCHRVPNQTLSDLKKFHKSVCESGISFSVILTGLPELRKRLRGEVIVKLEMTKVDSEIIQNLKDENKRLRHFVYSAYHDLRNPLTHIGAYCSILEEDHIPVSDKVGREYLNYISRSATRVSDILGAILEYSTVDLSLTIETVSITNVVKKIKENMASEIEEKKARISMDNILKINANPAYVHQLFSNLIGNSLKYSRDSVPPLIKIQGKTAGDFYIITVEDNGIGFDEKYSKCIFDVFQRLHAHKEYQGDGIGLALCQKIVDQYGGHIHAIGQKGEGAKFMIGLPKKMLVPVVASKSAHL